MGRIENQDECGDASLRRSTRKRKLKKEIDLDYDYEYHELQCRPNSSIPEKTPEVKKSKHTKDSRWHRVPEPAAYEEVVETYSESEDMTNFVTNNAHVQFSQEIIPVTRKIVQEKRKIVQEKRRIIFESLVKLEKPELIEMNMTEIIDVHCENLKRRLENIAYLYLETWSAPPPTYVVPHLFLGSNPHLYSSSESDELAVQKVVDNILNVVSSLY